MPDLIEQIVAAAREKWGDNHQGFSLRYYWGEADCADVWELNRRDSWEEENCIDAPTLPALLAKLKAPTPG